MSLSTLLIILATSSPFATVIHVPGDQPTIQEGIFYASESDTVLVAPGVYTGYRNRDIDFYGRNIVLKSEAGPEVTIIDCQATETDRHRGVAFSHGETSAAVLDGFTIRGGYAPWWAVDEFSTGGGILCDNNSNPTIIDNIIYDNHATGNSGYGGGISVHYSSPTIENNVIYENSSTFFGGGISSDGGDPVIRGNEISRNVSVYGGGIECAGGEPVIEGNDIVENEAASGGGIRCDLSAAVISSNLIYRNSGGSGGGIYAGSAAAEITGNTIVENYGSDGGGIACRGDVLITGNVMLRNFATRGGAVSFINSSATLTSNTISENVASLGSGLWLHNNSYPSVTNCIIGFGTSTHTGPMYPVYCDDPTAAATLTGCDVFGNSWGDWIGCIENQAGIDGNFSADPMFCSYYTGSYELQGASPCTPANSPNGELVGALGIGCAYVCGDADQDGAATEIDVEHLASCYFGLGCEIELLLQSVDMDCSGAIGINDLILLAGYVHGYGPMPCCAGPPKRPEWPDRGSDLGLPGR
jgi:hypothetical protein